MLREQHRRANVVPRGGRAAASAGHRCCCSGDTGLESGRPDRGRRDDQLLSFSSWYLAQGIYPPDDIGPARTRDLPAHARGAARTGGGPHGGRPARGAARTGGSPHGGQPAREGRAGPGLPAAQVDGPDVYYLFAAAEVGALVVGHGGVDVGRDQLDKITDWAGRGEDGVLV